MLGVSEDGKASSLMEDWSKSVSDFLSPGLAESRNAFIFFWIFLNIVNCCVELHVCSAGVVAFEIYGP